MTDYFVLNLQVPPPPLWLYIFSVGKNAIYKIVEKYLNRSINSWNYQKLGNVELSKEIEPLFIRYDKSKIKEERSLLKNK